MCRSNSRLVKLGQE